jgi:amidase
MEVMIPITMAAAAAIAVPAGFGARDLPMGLQIMGRNHDEFALLQLAHAYDEATGWVTKRPPPLLS